MSWTDKEAVPVSLLYYLQSRYYDPTVGRFINGDCYASTGQGFLGNNMFAYCLNNCVSFRDPSGESTTTADPEWQWVLWLLSLTDGPSPVVDVIAYGVCILFGFAQTSQKSLKQCSPDDELDSDDINWENGDKNHIIKGTDKQHVSGWEKMGVDPNASNAWDRALPILKEVVDNGLLVRISYVGTGITLKYALYYADAGINFCVKIYIGFKDNLPRISDAIPFEDILAYFKYISS